MKHHTFNQKYRNYIQPNNQNVYDVLDSRLSKLMPNWQTKNVLDFGCNNGHLIGTSNGALNPANVYGVDIHKPSLFIAKTKYPTGNWLHYNGYNATFNPKGERDAMFELPVQPDVIIAYGVFTHCGYGEMRKWLAHFESILSPGGVIAFSVWESTDYPGYLEFLRRSFNVIGPSAPAFERSMYLINRKYLVLDQDELGIEDADWVETFYKREFLLDHVPNVQFVQGKPTLHQVYAIQK